MDISFVIYYIYGPLLLRHRVAVSYSFWRDQLLHNSTLPYKVLWRRI